MRNLIVDYLTERQPSLDYSSLRSLSTVLASNFWADLERHHPGIDSLRLSVEISTAWKARLASKTIRARQPNGVVAQVTEPRARASMIKQGVRAFYLDIAHWALDEPERWGLWAAPSPISEGECSHKKAEQQQKSWADQRTRERLPVLPALVRAVDRQLKEARARLDALNAAPLGSAFTVLDETFTVPLSTQRSDGRPRTAIDAHGQRRDFGTEEKAAFWGWATIEILRHTGIRIEELRELGHHSIISYRLPSTGDTVPLLQIAPSKTDQERLLLVTPELADVLSAVVSRVRNESGVIPSISSYDQHERKWNAPMPLLYQWRVTGEDRRIAETTIRRSINGALQASGLVDNSGNPLRFMPHEFRRIFITDAILNGLPPHIAQVVAGHANINTTMGYAAIYPVEAIEAHRSFIARRRSLRPSEEYRAVTPEEWQDFLGHFERRKLALGECGRAYGTDCNHEHACVRCPVLVMSASDRPRLVEIRDNLRKRIAEAESEGWLGEVEGLSVSLDAADQKISQLDERDSRKTSPVFIGVPVFERITGRTIDNEEPTR
ncbi:site-specific integrase [Streptomyces pratensis]|uniref:site-specific integrase n=1 Tax=Streptomyces pratensis TaxID=1169025 RepID=UPI003015C80A